MPSPTSLSQVRADAIARRDHGDLHSARDLLERALEAAIMTSGEDHPEVLTTAHLLASLHRQSGDLSGARRVLENALYAGSSKHGDDHPLLLSISFDLAEIADELGNRHEARKHYTRVAKFGPAAPGFNQQQVQAARAWLGPSAPAPAVAQSQTVTLPGPEPLTAPSVEWPPKTTPPPPAT
ncbi:tetratricopeptide repeat protein, partial [Allorhizocola rhizosphaerae]|uniref:tetratricopeptide repeat protein n=1 Tax=Allorhizocola rhizosphaerae TaxID=1872709 RepID=UPI0013C337E5